MRLLKFTVLVLFVVSFYLMRASENVIEVPCSDNPILVKHSETIRSLRSISPPLLYMAINDFEIRIRREDAIRILQDHIDQFPDNKAIRLGPEQVRERILATPILLGYIDLSSFGPSRGELDSLWEEHRNSPGFGESDSYAKSNYYKLASKHHATTTLVDLSLSLGMAEVISDSGGSVGSYKRILFDGPDETGHVITGVIYKALDGKRIFEGCTVWPLPENQ